MLSDIPIPEDKSAQTKVKRGKHRRKYLLIGFLCLILVIGLFLVQQFYAGKELAEKYAQTAKLAAQSTIQDKTNQIPSQQSSPTTEVSASSNLSNTNNPSIPANPSNNSSDVPASNSNTSVPSNQQTPEASNPPQAPAPPVETPSQNYKTLMTQTYQNVTRTMENVKANTLALQNGKMSISVYKSTILQAKTDFTNAQKFIQSNSPKDEKLLGPYQDFLAGVTLAKDSMDVVLNGVATFNASQFYAAREMGKTARDQVVNAYNKF